MKFWSDLSWKEKCDIKDGRVNPYSYGSGYSFDVKQKVRDGQENNTKKIKDIAPSCLDPSHNPPSHQVFEPGFYEHKCPACGLVTVFEVPRIIC